MRRWPKPARLAPRVSGSLESHYAPRATLRLMDAAQLRAALQVLGPAFEGLAVYSRSVAPPRGPVGALWRAMPAQAEAAAHELFAVLRDFDAAGARLIWVEQPPPGPEWEGVRDRLQRAASADALPDFSRPIRPGDFLGVCMSIIRSWSHRAALAQAGSDVAPLSAWRRCSPAVAAVSQLVDFSPSGCSRFGDETSVITSDGRKYTVNALNADHGRDRLRRATRSGSRSSPTASGWSSRSAIPARRRAAQPDPGGSRLPRSPT